MAPEGSGVLGMKAGIRQIEKRIREEIHMWDGKQPDLDFVFGSR